MYVFNNNNNKYQKMMKHYMGYHNTFAAGGLTIQKGPWKPNQNDFVNVLDQEHAGHLGWKSNERPSGTQTTIPQIKTNSVKYKHDTFVPKSKAGGLNASYFSKKGPRSRQLVFPDRDWIKDFQQGGDDQNVSPKSNDRFLTLDYVAVRDEGMSEGGMRPMKIENSFNPSVSVGTFTGDDAVDDLLRSGSVIENPYQPLVNSLQQQDQINSIANDSQIIQNTNAAVIVGDATAQQLGPQVVADPGSYHPTVPAEVAEQQFNQFQQAVGTNGNYPTINTDPGDPGDPGNPGPPGMDFTSSPVDQGDLGMDFLSSAVEALGHQFPELRDEWGNEINALMDFIGISPARQIRKPSIQETLSILKEPTVVARSPEQESVREEIVRLIEGQIDKEIPHQIDPSVGNYKPPYIPQRIKPKNQKTKNGLKVNTTGMRQRVGGDIVKAQYPRPKKRKK